MASLFFVCLILWLFIPAYVANMPPVNAAQNVVKFLPGFEGPLPFHLETGYVGVGASNEFQLFYYFVESQQNPFEDPLILWQSGGPGCSPLGALMIGIGPLTINKVKYNGSLPTLRLNPYSLNKVANIIYLDSPVFTGFSYIVGKQDYELGDVRTAKLEHEFLRKWLMEHPQFLSNPLYIGGDSYRGILGPTLVSDIIDGNEDGYIPTLNLKGYILGNPFTDAKFDRNAQVPFAHGMGLISDELFEEANKSCKGNYLNLDHNQLCAQAIERVNQCLVRINNQHILEPCCARCAPGSPKPKLVGEKRRIIKENLEDDSIQFYCTNYRNVLLEYWANDLNVKKALQIDKESMFIDWMRCHDKVSYTVDVKSTVEYHKNITLKGYRALIYSGDHDINTTFIGTQAWIRSLDYYIVDDWRPWLVDGQVGGFTREYSNQLTFATIKGAGHEAQAWTPKECSHMLKKWISNIPL